MRRHCSISNGLTAPTRCPVCDMARNASAEAQTSAEELDRPEPALGHREGGSVNWRDQDSAAHRLGRAYTKHLGQGQRCRADKGSRAG